MVTKFIYGNTLENLEIHDNKEDNSHVESREGKCHLKKDCTKLCVANKLKGRKSIEIDVIKRNLFKILH